MLKLSSQSSTGTSSAAAQPLGERLGALGGAPALALGRQRQPEHDPLGVVRAHQRRDRVEIALAAPARDRRVRLRGQPQPVGHRHADAARAEIDADDPARHGTSSPVQLVVYRTHGRPSERSPGDRRRVAPQIQIDVDDATAQGAYSNLVLINHNENEFVLDFAYIQPAAPRARVRARIISSPRHTKRLLRALEHNLRRYEERFGKIEEPEPMPIPPLPPGGMIS